jgi:DNA mismatch repair protein MutS2
MEFDSATGKSTYRLITGIPGRSRAIDVAQMIGLPSSIISAARARLGDMYGETDTLLAQLQKRMSEVLRQQDEATRVTREVESERSKLAETRTQLEKEKSRLGATYRDELERLRDDVTRQVSNEIKHLRELDRSERANVKAVEVLKNVATPLERAIDFLPAEGREVHAGDKVEHRKFKVRGEVVSIDGGKAVLNVNGRKMTVDVRDLAAIPGAESGERRAQKIATTRSDDAVVVSAELNLIGQRVDDALDESDKFLDRALLEGKQAVRIIHGFGTGRLRQAIRDHLRKHPAVKSWRRGDENEGGDGATIAVLE